MGSAAIFAGMYVKLLKDKLQFGNTCRILTGTVDPTTNAQDAEAGSLYMRVDLSNPGLYLKMDAGVTTNWVKIDPIDEYAIVRVVAGVADLAGGSIYLPDGRVLMTWDGGGTNPSNFEGNLSVTLSTLMAPTIGLEGYLYIDLASLASVPTNITGTSLDVYPITASNFVMLTTDPENTDKTRYVKIAAFIGEIGPVWGPNNWYNFPRRAEPMPIKFVSPVAVTIPPTVISTVGATGQIMGGHVLDSDSFPVSSNLSFWNLLATLNDGSGQGYTLSGASPFTGTGLVGTDTAADIGNALTATNAFFSGSSGGPIMAAGWFKLGIWNGFGSEQPLLKVGQSPNDFVWEVHVNTDGSLGVSWSDVSNTLYNQNRVIASPNFANNSYHHVAFWYSGGDVRLYIDGRLSFSYTIPVIMRVSTTGLFTIGGAGYSMSVREVCFSTGYVWNDEDMRKLASYKITHNLGIPSYQQKWMAGRTRADAKITEELGDQGWLIDKASQKKLYIDFFDFNPLDSVYLKCEDQSTTSSLIVAPKTFDTGWLTAIPTFPIAHGLGDVPTAVTLLYESVTGFYSMLRVDNYLVWTGTQFTGDAVALGALTIDSSHKIRILCSIGANLSGTPAASLFSSGIVSTTDQHFNGNKWLQGNWLPETNNNFDLGSPTNRWKDIYMTGTLVGGVAEASLTVGGIVNITNQHFNGNKWLQGNWLPETDNLYDLGSTSLRWKTLHVGPGSVVVHNDATDTKKLTLDFDSTMARIASDSTSALELMIGASQVGLISTAGVWTVGVSGANVSHVVNGGLGLVNASFAVGNPALTFGNATTGLYPSATNHISFASNGALSGDINELGVWTVGTSGSTDTHTVNGYLAITKGLSGYQSIPVLGNPVINSYLFHKLAPALSDVYSNAIVTDFVYFAPLGRYYLTMMNNGGNSALWGTGNGTWHSNAIMSPQDGLAIAASPIYMVVGQSGSATWGPLFYSDSGAWSIPTYTPVVVPSVDVNDVIWVSALTRFVAVGNSGFFSYCSHAHPGIGGFTYSNNGSNNWEAVCWTGTKFVAVSGTIGANQVMTSSDGITWTNQSTPVAVQKNWTGVEYSPDLKAVVAVASGTTDCMISYDDGVTWSAGTMAITNPTNAKVIWHPIMRCFVSNRQFSVDGVSWNSLANSTGRLSNNNIYYDAFGDQLCFGTATTGEWAYSAFTVNSPVVLLPKDQGTANIIVNGGFDFWQRGYAEIAPANQQYRADRFQTIYAGGPTIVASRSLTVPNGRSPYSLYVRCSAAAPNQYASIQYTAEGYDLLPLVGKMFTVSFWVQTSKTGTFSVGFRNGLLNYYYVTTFTANAGQWEFKSITVPFLVATSYDHNAGIIINWNMQAGGGTDTAILNRWVSGDKFTATGQTDLCTGTAEYMRLAQVMLNLGTQAAPFQRAGGTMGGELALCQRYYEKNLPHDVMLVNGLASPNVYTMFLNTSGQVPQGTYYPSVQYSVEKRVAVSPITYPMTNIANTFRCHDPYTGVDQAAGTCEIWSFNTKSFRARNNSFASFSMPWNIMSYHWTCDCDF